MPARVFFLILLIGALFLIGYIIVPNMSLKRDLSSCKSLLCVNVLKGI